MAEPRVSTRVANTIDGGLAGVILDIGDPDPGAFPGAQFADRFADSVRATRNDSDLIFKPIHVGAGCYGSALRIVSSPDVAGPAGSSGKRKILSAAWIT